MVAVPVATLPAALALGNASHELVPLAGPLALAASILLFLPLVGGWLGDELRSGTALFWVQTPHSPLVLYAARFGGVAAMAGLLAMTVPAAAAGLLTAVGHVDMGGQILLRIPALGLNLGVLAVLVWGVGGWGVTGDAWAAPLLGAGLLVLELVARLQPAWLGPLAGPADAVGLPVDDLGIVAGILAGNGGDAAAVIRILPWLAAWMVLGALGVHVTARTGAVADPAT